MSIVRKIDAGSLKFLFCKESWFVAALERKLLLIEALALRILADCLEHGQEISELNELVAVPS